MYDAKKNIKYQSLSLKYTVSTHEVTYLYMVHDTMFAKGEQRFVCKEKLFGYSV
jgi:hypothetical protein